MAAEKRDLKDVTLDTIIEIDGERKTFRSAIEQGLKNGSIKDDGRNYHFAPKYIELLDNIAGCDFDLKERNYRGKLTNLMMNYGSEQLEVFT